MTPPLKLSHSRSHELFTRANKVIPGGVNSPVRAFRSVGGEPLFLARGSGSYVWDVDGNRYLDFVGSWGPLLFGHAPEFVLNALRETMVSGTSFGAPTELEVQLAELMCETLPGLEMVRMVNSGTEATMSAIRLARGVTGRDRIIKFNGCYHGHSDSLLVKAGSGLATLGIAGSPGVPAQFAELTTSIPYNDLALFEETIRALGPNTIACVIIEPVIGNAGLILPTNGYLAGLRKLTEDHGIVLIFDEVMTGFRVARGGAAERFGVTPDLVTYGKVIGGGLPVGAFGGTREMMSHLAPLGPIYQAGTLSGNPLAMAAGIAMLSEIQKNDPYPHFERLGAKWSAEFSAIGKENGVAISATSCGSMIGFFFSDVPITNYETALGSDVERFKRFFHAMLSRGVYLAPSAFEAGFLSAAHTESDIEFFLTQARDALKTL